MEKQLEIERIQDWVSKGYIRTDKELRDECLKYGLEWFDDILSPMEWNCCDRCGTLYDSMMLHWIDYDDDPSEGLLRGLESEATDYCALCDDCVKELVGKGERLIYLENKVKVAPLDKEERYELNNLKGE